MCSWASHLRGEKEHFNSARNRLNKHLQRLTQVSLGLPWNERNLWDGVSGACSGTIFSNPFEVCVPRGQISLVLATLSFYLKHEGNNIYHSNKGASSLSSLLTSSVSRHVRPSPALTNRWIQAHLEVESFIEELITDPDFTITSEGAPVICHKTHTHSHGLTCIERSLQCAERWLWRLQEKLISKESTRLLEGPPKSSIMLTHSWGKSAGQKERVTIIGQILQRPCQNLGELRLRP